MSPTESLRYTAISSGLLDNRSGKHRRVGGQPGVEVQTEMSSDNHRAELLVADDTATQNLSRSSKGYGSAWIAVGLVNQPENFSETEKCARVSLDFFGV